jgi:hypothetical protein
MHGRTRGLLGPNLSALILITIVVFSCNAFGAPPQFVISGYVQTNSGVGVEGVNVIGDNGASSTVTEADGSYSITVPNHWSGTITVSKAGWLITPVSKSYSRVSANIANENYIAYQPKISGYVKRTNGTALSGATVSASGAASTTTNASGYYEIIVPYDWSGTLTASKSGYNFTAKNYTNITTDQTNQDFTGYQPMISGYVKKADGTALSGATVSANNGGGSGLTDAGGYYEIIVPYNWSGTLTASLTGYGFTAKNYTNITTDRTNQNFTGFQPTISGYVKKADGTALSGATVSANNGGGSGITDASGYYEIIVPYNWSGILTASLTGYGFTAKNYTNITTDQTNQNFTAFQPTISGTVRDDFGVPLANVGIALSNLPSEYTTGSNGSYEFTVPYNWSGSVIPHMINYVFIPNKLTYTAVQVNQVNQDHTGYHPSIISGHVYNAQGQGIAGITITDGQGMTAVTDSYGYYEFIAYYGWSGTLKAFHSSMAFEPEISLTNVTDDIPGQDFNETIQVFTRIWKVSNGYDDAYSTRWSNGSESTNISSSTLKVGHDRFYDTDMRCGLRFQSFDITKESEITDAYITLIRAASLPIYEYIRTSGERNANPSQFSSSGPSLWTRNKTSAYKAWGWTSGSAETPHRINELNNIVEEITALPDWSPGNPIVFLLDPFYTDDYSSPFIFYAYGTGKEATLTVTYKYAPRITGQVVTIQGAPLADVQVVANNGGGKGFTDSQGYYELNVPPNWGGTLTPSKTFWAFDTQILSYQNICSDISGQNYIAMPTVGLNKTAFNFTAYGKSYAVVPQSLIVSSPSHDTLNWQIQTPNDCNWLTVTPQSGQVADGNSVVTLSVDPNKADYGTNTCQFNVIDLNLPNNPQTVTVNLTVNGPSLYIYPRQMTVYAQKDSNTIVTTFTVQNTGYDTMNWSIDEVNDCSWITAITPSSGQCQRDEIDTVAITINPAGLDNGTYQKILTIRSPEYASPKPVYIDLQVYTPNTIYVPMDYNTIQEAVNAAHNGDIIIIYPGRYAGFNNYERFLTIQSTDPENPAIVAATIIEATVYFSNDAPYAVAESFINGLSFIYNPEIDSQLEGIIFNGGNATIKNCIIRNFPGVGIVLYNYSSYKAHARIENCLIANNGFLCNQHYSGGIFAFNYDIELRNSLISNNYSEGLVLHSQCTDFVKTDIINCTIAENGSNNPAVTASCIKVTADALTDISIKNSILSGISDSNLPIIKINPTLTSPSPLINLNIDCSAVKGAQAAISAPNDVNIIWGQGNIESDPCFARQGCLNDNNTPDYLDDYWIEGDYHLKSHTGRWQPSEFIYMDAAGDGIMDMTDFAVLAAEWQSTSIPVSSEPSYYPPYLRADLDRNGIVDYNDLALFCGNYCGYYDYGQWVSDEVNSPCIDAGDPNSDWSNELWPHGKRVNMGAFGNTPQASMSSDTSGNAADLNNDGRVNLIDYARFSSNIDKPSFPLAEDINRDGLVDFFDLRSLCENWLWSE